MKSSEKTLIAGAAVVVAVLGIWLLVISPKMKEADQVAALLTTAREEVAAQELLVAEAEAAQAGFDTNYSNLVYVGKAVPGDADTPGLLTQLIELADAADVRFQGITLDTGSTGSPTATTAEPAAEGEAAAEPAATPAPVATAPAAATEAAAAGQPLGATVGPAGLPVMPYTMTFQGDFFEIAKFFGLVDNLVAVDETTGLNIDGRLITIDGFEMAPDEELGFPYLTITVKATTFVAPETDAGGSATGAATPAGVAPATGGNEAPATGTPVTAAVSN